jgi:hypothetical protein
MAIVTNPSMSEHQTTLAQQELQLAGLVKLKCKSGNIGNQELEVKLPELNVQPFNGKDAPNSLCPVYSNWSPFTETLVIFMTLILMHQFTSNVCHSMSHFVLQWFSPS